MSFVSHEENHHDTIPGLGIIESCSITNNAGLEINICPILAELSITQNLYDTFITGELVLGAVDGVLESNGIILNGQETLSIKVRSSTSFASENGIERGKVLQGSFVIYAVNKNRSSVNQQLITLRFVSKECIKNKFTKISKWFEPQRRSEMVEKIYNNYLKSETNPKELEDIDKTEDTAFTCVIPNWTPHQTIRWLINSSTSADDNSCKQYVFYEAWNGDDETSKFNLKAWTKLNNQEPVVEYIHRTLNTQDGGVFVGQHSNIEFSKPQEFNTEKTISKGTWASKLLMHDLFRKKIVQQNFSYSDEANPKNWPKTFLNEEKRNIISSADANPSSEVKVLHTNRYSYKTTETVEGNEKYKKWVQSSTSQRETTGMSTLNLVVVGDTSRHPGQVINIKKPIIQIKTNTAGQQGDMGSPKKGNFENVEDKNNEIGGKWLVVGVTHHFKVDGTAKGYVTESFLQCKRDGAPSLEGFE